MRAGTLRRYLLLMVALPLVVAILSVAVLYVALRESALTADWVSHTNQVISLARSLVKSAVDAETGERGYVISGTDSFLEPYRTGVAEFEKSVVELRELTGDRPAQLKRVARIEELFGRWRREVAEVVIASRRDAPAGSRAAQVISVGAGKEKMDAIRALVGSFVEVEEQLLAVRRARSARAVLWAERAAVLAPALAALLAVLVAFRLSLRLSRPLISLTATARQFTDGRLDARTEEVGPREVQLVCRTFNNMADSLQRREQELRLLNELAQFLAASRDMAEATRVVGQLLPDLLPGSSGSVYATRDSKNTVEPVVSWGQAVAEPFEPDACWALRRGRTYEARDVKLRCAHAAGPGEATQLCVPLIAHGETLGLLHVRRAAPDRRCGDMTRIAEGVSEQVAMAVANLRLRESLRAQSIRDGLTGLYNRRYLEETIDRELSRARREQRSLAVAVIDVDHFKRLNDEHGHQAGDEVLRRLGQLLRAELRQEDVACRYGGEEFVVLMPGATLEECARRADAMRIAFRGLTIVHEGSQIAALSFSAGVAAFPQHGLAGAALIHAADAALYQAKRCGRDQVRAAPTGPTGIAGAPRVV